MGFTIGIINRIKKRLGPQEETKIESETKIEAETKVEAETIAIEETKVEE